MGLINFLQYSGEFHPDELYEKVYPDLVENNFQTIYVSGGLTTSGAEHLKKTQPQISLIDIIQLNTAFAENFLNTLGDNQDKTVILPHHLGKLHLPTTNEQKLTWGQGEYLAFWVMVITRCTPTLATKFWKFLQKKISSLHKLNDFSAHKSDRIKDYHLLESLVISFFKKHTNNIKIVHQMWTLPDAQHSLGSTLEQRIGYELGVQVLSTQVNPDLILTKNPKLASDPVYKILLQLNFLDTIAHPHQAINLLPQTTKVNYLIN